MKKRRDCPHCGKPVPGSETKQWFNGVHARWHPKCYIAARQQFIEKTFPPRVERKKASKGARA